MIRTGGDVMIGERHLSHADDHSITLRCDCTEITITASIRLATLESSRACVDKAMPCAMDMQITLAFLLSDDIL